MCLWTLAGGLVGVVGEDNWDLGNRRGAGVAFMRNMLLLFMAMNGSAISSIEGNNWNVSDRRGSVVDRVLCSSSTAGL